MVNSISMYALKVLSFGASPMAMPRMRRAASSRRCRTSSCAAMTQILPNVNCW
jgi:hypothetical protein